MIKLIGNDIWRETKKIGWVHEPYIYDHAGTKRGYVEGHYIHDMSGKKLAYLEGDYIKTEDGRTTVKIEDNRAHVTGGSVSDLYRGAIRMFLGD